MSGGGFGGGYRRQAADRRRRVLFICGALMALCGVSYWWGGEMVRSSESAYKQQAVQLRDERARLEQTITTLESEVQSTQVRYQQLEARYLAEVPQGDFRKLTDLVKKQLDGGIKASRLVFAIESARPPKNCAAAQMKRFVANTPVYSGPHGAVSFGNGAITVMGSGAPAVGPAGNPEAWYDPGKPVKITFTEIGGKETVKDGLLPLQHSMILGNKEHRFTVAAGERSFISVTSDHCDYP